MSTIPRHGEVPRPVTIEIAQDHPYKSRGKGKSGCAICGGSIPSRPHIGVPKSVNHYLAKGWQTYRADKKAWEEVILRHLEASTLPKGLETVRAEAHISFNTRQRRDEGNFRFFIEKCLGDAMQTGGWLKDDSFYLYQFDRVHPVEADYGFTRFTITPMPGDLP